MRKTSLFYIFLFGLLSLSSCKSTQYVHLADIDNRIYRIGDGHKDLDNNIDEMIKPYRQELSKEMDIILIENEVELFKRKPNSSLGAWMTDVMKEAVNSKGGNVDFTIQNYGGLRIQSLPAREISVGKVYELMPFDNMLLVLELSGEQVQNLCNRMAQSGGWPISDGLEFTIIDTVAEKIIVSNKKLDLKANYRVGMPDYIANGGDGFKLLKEIKKEKYNILIRDALIDWLAKEGRQGEKLNYITKDRIHE